MWVKTVAVVSSCAVRPDYRASELTVPALYSESGVHVSTGTSPAEWWWVFDDAPLAGRIRDIIEVQDRRQEQALLAYRQAVLLGLEEVENALVTHREARLRFQALSEAEGAERAVGQDLVRLYKALGGGWDHEGARAQVTQPSWLISSEE